MRKIVAVLGYGKKRQESTFTYPVDTINAGYASSIIKAGALPFLVPSTRDPDIIRSTVQKVDGILIPGGNDIDPFLYGEKAAAYLEKGARPLPAFADYPNPQIGWGTLCLRESLPVGVHPRRGKAVHRERRDHPHVSCRHDRRRGRTRASRYRRGKAHRR